MFKNTQNHSIFGSNSISPKSFGRERPVRTVQSSQTDIPCCRLAKVMANAFNRPEDSDLTFKVKQNEEFKHIYGHKWFIRANNKHFETMFSSNWTESQTNEIVVNDHSYEAYYAFIRFLYTDSIDTKNVEVLVELLDISNAYFEDILKQRCTQLLKHLITVSNVCDLYSAAVKYSSTKLEEHCFKFMINAGTLLTKTDGYQRMDLNDIKRFNTNYIEYMSPQNSFEGIDSDIEYFRVNDLLPPNIPVL